jgi:acetoacetyl-CoA synthetase
MAYASVHRDDRESAVMTQALWRPSAQQAERRNLTHFMTAVRRRWQHPIRDYEALYQWSIEEPEQFWQTLWDFAGVVGEVDRGPVLERGAEMLEARWFPEVRLNFAENLLRRRDDAPAIVFSGEAHLRRSLSHAELYAQVARVVQALQAAQVGPGDRVAGLMPNIPETVVAMLATTALGAVWSSCSPDFGVEGVLDRFGQIDPKILFTADGYLYNGKRHDGMAQLPELLQRLPSVQRAIVVPYTKDVSTAPLPERALSYPSAIAEFESAQIRFQRLPFNHPLYVMYSSGTTGKPKCIVHGAGGTLLQHLKEHQLHVDLKPDDRLFYYTTCGWMMWNWLVSGLASGATLVLYDGSPFYPTTNALFDFADSARINVFGTSAKYIDAVKKAGLVPRTTHSLAALRSILSTGSPLAPESFDFVYESVKPDVLLCSISGGTDIISCFVLGNPLLPVWRGEIQCRGLGMKVEVFDESGRCVRGEKGELVCTAPFPSMPIGFWNDPEDRKYRAAYFEKYPGVWCHGDFAELTEHDGIIIHGRSDAVLNPGGVRIGTAEIYRQVEQLDEIVESLVIGQDWDSDTRLVLFLRLREGTTLTAELIDELKRRIRLNTTPHHVPAKIIQVADIPRTRSGKIVELAVRDVVHGREVKNREALANPQALECFRDLSELKA